MPTGRSVSPFSDNVNEKTTIISASISCASSSPILFLIDTGADISVLHARILNSNSIINRNDIENLNSFSDGLVKTIGSISATIHAHGKSIIHKFLIVDSVRMNKYDAILGKDFLFHNKVLLDFRTGQLLIGDQAKIVNNIALKPIIKKNEKSQITKKEKKAISNNEPTRFGFDFFEDIEEINEINFCSEIATNDFVRNNYENDIINRASQPHVDVIFMCKNGKIYCNRNEINNENEINNTLNNINIDKSKQNEKRIASMRSNKNYSISLFSICNNKNKGSSNSHMLGITSSEANNKNGFLPTNFVYDQSMNDMHTKNLCLPKSLRVNLTNNETTINKQTNSCDQLVGKRRRPKHPLYRLREFCSSSLYTCNINTENANSCVIYLFDHISTFSQCVRKGTNMNVIIETLDVYNRVICELKKFFIRDSARKNLDINLFPSSLGKITIKFRDVFEKDISMKNILHYLYILKKEIILLSRFYNKTEPKQNEIITNENKCNPIYKAINTIYATKKYITIPARSRRIISVFVKTNNEQISLAQEIQMGVFTGNCIIKAENNIASICVLNATPTDISLNDIQLQLEPLENYDILNFEKVNMKESDRAKKIIELIDMNGLNETEKNELIKLINEYSSIFHLDGEPLSYTSALEYDVKMKPNSKPVCVKNYKLPLSQREEVNRQVQKLIKDGMVKPIISEYNSPMILVPKGKGNEKKWRLVFDFRRLNEEMEKEFTAMDTIPEILDKLGKSDYFSALDLSAGFNQIKTSPDAKKYLCFTHNNQQYGFERMPFGVANGPNTFNRLMRSIMVGIQDVTALIFIDDILVLGYDLESHIKNLRQVFDRLKQHNLKLKPDKLSMLRKETIFLGHLVKNGVIMPDPAKVEAIKKITSPKNVRDIRSVLGVFNFYFRFIKNFALLAKPLTMLLKKDAEFVWTDTHEQSLQALKIALIDKCLLYQVDPNKPYVVETDASGYAIGASLNQLQDNGQLHPVAFLSRTLNDSERRYTVSEREMLAIVYAIKYWRNYLMGYQFTVYCDHLPLKFLFSSKDSYNKLFRMKLFLANFDFVVLYKQGKSNIVPDFLSRYLSTNIDGQKPNTLSSNSQIRNNQNDQNISLHNKANELSTDQLYMHENGNNSNRTYDDDSIHVHVTTRRQASEQKQKEQTKKDEGETTLVYDEDLRLKTKTYDNYISYVAEKRIFNTKMIERPFSHNKIEKNTFKLSNTQSINDDTMNIEKLHEYLYIEKINEQMIFHLCILDRLSYDTLFVAWYTMYEYMIRNNIMHVCSIVNNKYFAPLDYAKAKQMLRYIFHGSSILITLYFDEIIELTDQKEIDDILYESHYSIIGGHCGIRRTLEKLKHKYFWKNMKNDIRKTIRSCDTCQRNKITKKTKMEMQIVPVQGSFGIRWHLDIVGPLPRTPRNYIYILTCLDELSRYVVAIPLEDQETHTIARAFVDNVILKYGSCKEILSDRGANFCSSLMKRVCKLLGIKDTHTTAYRPQSNGSLERFHRELKENLRNFVGNKPDSWDLSLQAAISHIIRA